MNFKDYLTSPPFEFIVGANRRSFFVNASLIASQSKPLTSLVSGSGGGSSPERGQMRESIERRAILEDIDEDTFARFVEFALTNSYTPAQPCEYVSEDEEEESDGDDESEEDDEDMDDEESGPAFKNQSSNEYDDLPFTEIPTMMEQNSSGRKRRKGRKREIRASTPYGGVGKRTKSGSNYKFPPSPVPSARSGVDSDNEYYHQRGASNSSVSTMVLNTSLQQAPVMYGRFTATGPVFSAQPPQGYGFNAFPSANPPRKTFTLTTTNSSMKSQPHSFNSLPFAAAPPPRSPPAPKRNELDEDYSPVFLSHAKLYVFAEKYDVVKLRALTLHNLHSCLSLYKVYPDPAHEGEPGGHGARDIVNLINYAYENTLNDEGEELRKLVSWFCAWRAKALLQCKFYCGCLEVGGMGVGFVRDLVGKLATMAPSD